MRAEIPFGTSTIEAEIPDRAARLPNVPGAKLPAIKDLAGALREAIENPIGSPRVRELAKPGSKAVIAFDDATVMSFGPVRGLAIKLLLAELESAGVPRKNVWLICANALHRKFRPHEMGLMIGPDLVAEFGERCLCHDAEDRDAIVDLGKTAGGYDVEINRHVAEASTTIYVNAGHNRGFTGGWKSVCVGLSTYKSIRHHHTPDGMSMSIEGNRMHAMLDEMGAHLERKIDGKIFKIDTILANPFQAARVFAGSVWETRKAAMRLMSELYPARRDLASEKFDVILYGVPSWSPYAVYAKMNPLLTLVSSGLGYLGGTIQALGKPGCTVIMATPCPNEWDRVHHASYPEVWETVLPQTRDPYAIARDHAERFATHPGYIEKYRHEYAFHPIHAILAAYPLRRLQQVGKVIVAGIQEPAVARHLGFEAAKTVEEAVAMAEATHGKNCSVGYVEQPTVPSKGIL